MPNSDSFPNSHMQFEFGNDFSNLDPRLRPAVSAIQHSSSTFPSNPSVPFTVSPCSSPLSSARSTPSPSETSMFAAPPPSYCLGPWRVLTDANCARLNEQSYNPYWMVQLGVDVEDIEWHSPTKIPKLFMEGVLLQNDSFVVTVDIKNGNGVRGTSRKAMKVHSVSRSWYPTMEIPKQDPSAAPIILYDAHGIRQIIDQLISENPDIVAANRGAYASTKAITVYRNDYPIGSLYNITKTWDIYVQEIDAWATRNAKPRRARRAARGSGLMWRRGRFWKRGMNGTWVPVDDQLQLKKK